MPDVIIIPENNGPYHIQGPVTLKTEAGEIIEVVQDETWLCRCGHSSTKPFCDGSHEAFGFQSDLDTATGTAAAASATAGDAFTPTFAR